MEKLKNKLRTKNIHPTLWRNVIDENPQDSIEYKYAKNILPIPCDQRYSKKDMKYIVETIFKILEESL